MRCFTPFVAIAISLTIVACTTSAPTGPTPTGQTTAQLASDAASVAASPRCTDAIGFSDTQITSGTVSGSFANGSGSFTAVAAAGTEDEVRISGTFANGRMTGSLAAADGATGTFTANRQ